MNKALPYNIGLDISISGIGWCVTDSDGRILRHDKNHLWGNSLFQPANTAKERKQNRSTRRRLARKHARLMVLRSLLEDDVLAADDSFYIRLDETSLDRADRTTESLYSILPAALFTDGSEIVADRSSGKQNLPIYKIRKLLCETDRQADIRYVYLAISHILKSRGHFQMDDKTQVVEAKADAVRYLQDAFETINDRYVLSVLTDSEALEGFCDELIDPQKTVDDVQESAVADLAQKRQNRNVLCAVVSLLMGHKVKLNTILLDAEEKDLSFAELEDHSVYDDLDEEQLEIILCLRDIYDWRMHRLAEEDHLSVSDQMTMRYEQHRKDLRELKDWMRTYVAVDEYRSMFHSDTEDVNYNAYVQSRTDPEAYEGRSWKSCSQDDFYLKLRKILSSCDDPEGEEKAQELISRMYDAHGVMIPNGFLPLQRIRYNSVLTNHAQTRDLMAILDKQSKYYATIRENRDRIIQLCEFHLPYYVGPLRQDGKSPFKPWIVYKAQGRGPVMPWDFEQRIDLDATAENYMKGLTNQCTFIPSEQVLPKHSLLYEEYMLLDELNRVRINGKLIKPELKKRAVIELFSRYRRVTDTLMTKWLRQQEEYADVEEIEIASANGELKHKFDASLGSLIDMQRIFERPFVMTDPMIPDLEKIIRWSTVFKDREIYFRKLDNEFGNRFTPQQMLELKARNYKEWGKLSEQLLGGIILKTPDGDKTVIGVMRDTNDNLMRVYHSKKYNMHEVLAQINDLEDDKEISYDEVDEITCSPALKRAIWQSVRIVRELTDFMGHEPGSIYLRNMRDDNSQRRREGNRKHSRYDKVRQLFDLYEKETGEKIDPSLRAELQKDKDEMSDVQYLYLTQMGKCMYSGRQIDLNDVGTYMMDSVVPLCLLPDDSIDNKVLILTEENRRGNKQAMPDAVIRQMTPYWTKLNRLGLISGRKLKKLQTRVYEDNELRVYLSSQWTETSRIINKVTCLFKKHYTKTHVYGINARLTQHFRKEEKLFALRDLNDMHQAYEAFLTAHIGVFADKYLPKVTDEESYNRVILGVWERAGEGDKNGLIIAAYNCDQQDEHGESIWSGAEARKEYVRKAYDWHDYYVTNLPVIYQGKYFTETMYRPGDSIPAKEFKPAGKYGGFIRAETAYMAIIEYEKKDKKQKEVINVPAYVAARAAHEPSFLQGYIAGTLEFTEEKGYRNVRVIRDRIKLNQEILLDGHEFYLRSAHELVNARQLYMPHDDLSIIWNALTLPPDEIQNRVDNGSLSTEKLDQVLVHLMDKLEKEYPVYPKLLQQIREGRDQISRLQAYDKALLICALVMSMNNKGIRIQGYTKKMKEKILGTADNRIKNKKVCGEDILLVNRSVTGIRKQIIRV